MLKLFLAGTAVGGFEKLRQYGLFAHLFPATEQCLAELDQEFPLTLVLQGLENTDDRVREDQPVTPAFLFAVLLWEPVRQRAERKQAAGTAVYEAIQQAATELLPRQLKQVALPRRFSAPMQEIWALQPRFENTRGKRPQRLMGHPRFRAAYDFLLLRAAVGEADPALARWWTERQAEEAETPSQAAPERRRGRRGRRGRRRKSASADKE